MKLNEIASRSPMFPMVKGIKNFGDVLKKDSLRSSIMKRLALKEKWSSSDFKKLKELKPYHPCLEGVDRISLFHSFLNQGSRPSISVLVYMSFYPDRGFDLSETLPTMLVNYYDAYFMASRADNIISLVSDSNVRGEMMGVHYDTPYIYSQVQQYGYEAVCDKFTDSDGILCNAWVLFK
jgi:hypothetical protein